MTTAWLWEPVVALILWPLVYLALWCLDDSFEEDNRPLPTIMDDIRYWRAVRRGSREVDE